MSFVVFHSFIHFLDIISTMIATRRLIGLVVSQLSFNKINFFSKIYYLIRIISSHSSYSTKSFILKWLFQHCFLFLHSIWRTFINQFLLCHLPSNHLSVNVDFKIDLISITFNNTIPSPARSFTGYLMNFSRIIHSFSTTSSIQRGPWLIASFIIEFINQLTLSVHFSVAPYFFIFCNLRCVFLLGIEVIC